MSLPAPLAAVFLLPSLSPLLLGTKMWCRMSFLDGFMATVGAEKRIMMTNFDLAVQVSRSAPPNPRQTQAEAKESSANEGCIISALLSRCWKTVQMLEDMPPWQLPATVLSLSRQQQLTASVPTTLLLTVKRRDTRSSIGALPQLQQCSTVKRTASLLYPRPAS